MENSWAKIYRTTNIYRVEIIKGMLIEEGIECVQMNKKDSSCAFGEIELYCQSEDVMKAIDLIENIDKKTTE
ncbi:MAG: DUF2007 domain-containing protein [Bacteroidetes bacterium]|nr:DUF2007 domain-containing protein [Bacteroidota bacterium]